MARRPHIDEDPSPEDLDKFGGETVRCPGCGAEVHDEAEWCHKCGGVMHAEDKGVPLWAWATGLVLLLFIVVFGIRLF